ncbi:DNA replication complex GINS protein PSF2-like protein [Brevipalpus obovatus]|uniref:DNA replication complex GINS protein PSF2-like protein n=1 Tax=Brevipalpus obovatus TaxID=246614 RepID=UPI003D9F14B9
MDLCEFQCEEEKIMIVPNFKYMNKLHLISCDVGPFIPGVQVEVPLWLALNLHEQHKCSIKLPNWIRELVAQVRSLQESTSQDPQASVDKKFDPMPHEHWREIIKLLQQHISSVPDCNDLIERREAILKHKMRDLFNHIRESDSLVLKDIDQITMRNITKAEMYVVKVFIQKAVAHLQRLRGSMAALGCRLSIT